MRVDVESFLALVVLIGGGAAIGAAVITSDGSEAPIAPVVAPEDAPVERERVAGPAEPVIPRVAKTSPRVETPTTEPLGTFTSTLLEPVPDEDPSAIPGPDVEAF